MNTEQEQPEVMEWTRTTINSIMIKRNEYNTEWLYHINIVCKPNPLNYDGINEVIIEIIRKSQNTGNTEVYFTTKDDHCFSILEAMTITSKAIITNADSR